MIAPKLTDYEKRIQELNKFIKKPRLLLKDFTDLIELTTDDLQKCLDISNTYPGDLFWQRLVVRSTFSIIDSACYKLKELSYCIAKHYHFELSEYDQEMLIGYKINDEGIIKTGHPPCAKNVKFTLEIASRIFNSNPIVFDKNWDAFLKTIRIRNRLTHPKSVSDLSISQEEYAIASDAFSWFQKRLFEITVASSGVAKVIWRKK
jgi:hypothetical protein